MSDEPRQALCCVCGALRTCRRPRNYRRENYWLSRPVDRDWHREVGDLKCAVCGRVTTHALICPEDDRMRDHAELLRYLAHGWSKKPLDAADLERIRTRWREGLPRNPYTRHLWWAAEADKARDAGQAQFQAFCMEWIPVPPIAPPRKKYRTYQDDEMVEPRGFHDVDREDPETGLWWYGAHCVECLRRSNDLALQKQREALQAGLQKIVDKVPQLDARSVANLLDLINAKGDD